MSKRFDVTTEYETYKDCYFILDRYMEDNSVYLAIWNDEDGPIADLTRCLGLAEDGYGYLDMNNCPWAANLVKELEIAKDTGMTQRSGYCIYPLYEFDIDKVNEYVKEVA